MPDPRLHNRISALIERELARAVSKHGSMTNRHEAYAVVKEEFDEWWAMIMADNRDPLHRIKGAQELIQMAAMCHRALFDVYSREIVFIEAKG